jgi:hypothetical protein
VASGSVATNPDGSFSFTTQASSLGTVQATTVDLWGLASNVAKVTLTANPPVITSLTAEPAGNNVWDISGTVTDQQNPAGIIVQLGGLPELQGVTATVGSDGTFSVIVQLQAGETGTISAQATDWWGLQSAVVYDPLT